MPVPLTTVYDAAGVAPKVTADAAVNPVPVMVTEVPPATGPAVGLIPVTTGNTTKVNSSAAPATEIPPTVVTAT